jgi:hypothetical protein
MAVEAAVTRTPEVAGGVAAAVAAAVQPVFYAFPTLDQLAQGVSEEALRDAGFG